MLPLWQLPLGLINMYVASTIVRTTLARVALMYLYVCLHNNGPDKQDTAQGFISSCPTEYNRFLNKHLPHPTAQQSALHGINAFAR